MSKFKVGDRVRFVEGAHTATVGDTGTVVRLDELDWPILDTDPQDDVYGWEPALLQVAYPQKGLDSVKGDSVEIGAEYDAAAHCVTLAECPPGLFLWNGTVGFKSEYGAMEPDDSTNGKFWKIGNRADAYCADSGEYFWGGAASHEDRAKVLVYTICAETVAMVASHGSPTLTRRDRFAMAALTGLLANNDASGIPLAFAVMSYDLADAMELARNKEGGE